LSEGVFFWIRAKINALLPTDWKGSPGHQFRNTLSAVSLYCKQHIQPRENLEELAELTWTRAKGEGNEKFAQALKSYAEEESLKIANRVAARTAEDQIRASRATADKLESEARLSEMQELTARADLVERCRQLGVIPIWNQIGHMTIVKAPPQFNWDEFAESMLVALDSARTHANQAEPGGQRLAAFSVLRKK
jgi:hypothetical protein